MKGKYEVTVKNNVLQYQFEIRRNITVIRGDSASGKTTLVEMVREYYENGEKSGVVLQCRKTCAVLEGRQWKVLLDNISDSIVFIDEGNLFVASDEFASAVKNSDNYYVIVSREGLPNLPYSVDEIYGIRSSGKYGSLHRTYQEFYHIYGNYKYGKGMDHEVLIVEDSNAGYEFFSAVAKEKDYLVESAGGKSNIFGLLDHYKEKRVLIIADGAAFGCEMDKIMKKIRSYEGMILYLPESFEWLILSSDVIKDKDVGDMIEHPEEYIESRVYMSWERFFTALLVEKTKDTYLHYSKSRLNESYKNKNIMDKILDAVPDGLI